MDAWIWIVIAVAVVVVLALIWLSARRSRRLDEQRDEARELRQQAETRAEEADERRAAAEQMAQRAEARRMRVQSPRPAQRAEAPDVSQQVLLLEDALRVLGEGDEQLVLLRRELHGLAGNGDEARGEVDLEVADRKVRVARAGRAAQNGTHAGDELVVDERAHHVIVAAAREAAHAVDRVPAGADHDYRHVAVPSPAGLAFAQTAADLEPGGVRQDRVEEDEAGPRLLDELERGRGPVRGEDFEPVVCELLLQVGAHGRLVLDHQDRPANHGRGRY